MADMIKLILVLTTVTAVAGLAIGLTNSKLEEKIAAQKLETQQAAITAVFPEGVTIDETAGSAGSGLPEKYWRASAGGVLMGYAFEMAGGGYAGDINFIVGVTPDGKILGMTVLSHNETPGLGSRINEIASTMYIWYPVGGQEKLKPWFMEQFEGLSALTSIGIDKKTAEWHKLDKSGRDDLREKNTVTAITGSTITTLAFMRAIAQNVKRYLDAIASDGEQQDAAPAEDGNDGDNN